MATLFRYVCDKCKFTWTIGYPSLCCPKCGAKEVELKHQVKG